MVGVTVSYFSVSCCCCFSVALIVETTQCFLFDPQNFEGCTGLVGCIPLMGHQLIITAVGPWSLLLTTYSPVFEFFINFRSLILFD